MNVYYDPAIKKNITEDQLVSNISVLEETILAVRRSIDFWEVNSQIMPYIAAEKLAQYYEDFQMLSLTMKHYQQVLGRGPIGRVEAAA